MTAHDEEIRAAFRRDTDRLEQLRKAHPDWRIFDRNTRPHGCAPCAGYVIEGRAFPTLEVVVTESPAELRKVMHPDLGPALIDLDRSEA